MKLYFEIEHNVNRLGLLERTGREEYHFISDRAELKPDHCYYLYFRNKSEPVSPSNY